jgi:hypothetical protein
MTTCVFAKIYLLETHSYYQEISTEREEPDKKLLRSLSMLNESLGCEHDLRGILPIPDSPVQAMLQYQLVAYVT